MPSTPGSAQTLRARQREPRFDLIEKMLLVCTPRPHSTLEIVAALRRDFRISQRLAYRDLAEVWQRRASEQARDRAALVAEAEFEWRRREAIADDRGETHAGNIALRERHKLLGLYAPKKIEHSGSVGVSMTIDVKLDILVGVLDAKGLAALDVVLEQIEAARSAGLLPEPKSEEDGDEIDAEIVDATPLPAPVPPVPPVAPRPRRAPKRKS